jgi:anti-sigma factor RsiW
MRGCPEWRDAVVDGALADAVEPALAAHLAACPECADALRECRRATARIDETLRRRAAVEPPPYGPDRVMARIGEHNPPRTIRWWMWALAGGAAMLLMVGSQWKQHPQMQTSLTTLASWRSPTDTLLQPPVRTAWNTVPRVGDVFFEVKPTGDTHAQ